jgi:hypothetical protein
MLGLQTFILFACLGGFAVEPGLPPIWLRAAIPTLAGLAALALRDRMRRGEHRGMGTALADAVAVLAALALTEAALIALTRAHILNAAWALSPMRDSMGAMSLPILSVLRLGAMLGEGRPADLADDYRAFCRRTRWRNMFETGALGLTAVIGVFVLSRATPGLVPTLGWLMTGGYIAVVFFLATEGWARPLPPEAQGGALRALYRDELARQNRVRRAMWWIWFVPLFAGLVTNLMLKGMQTADPLRVVLGLGAAALLATCIVGLNRDRSQGVVRKIAILNLAGR